MTPSWSDPRFRLIEGGATFSHDDLAALADRMASRLRAAGGRAAVAAGAVAPLIAALAAAETAGVELALCRSGLEPIPADAAVDSVGKVEVRTTNSPPGFAVLLATSGTSGAPKLARHDPARLLGRLRRTPSQARWLLTYEPGAFAGLQVILTALASGATLIAEPGADAAALAHAAARHGATHASGTPSFWRAFLLAAPAPPPFEAITLGGEAADQATLDRLAAAFPQAKVRHLYASTEAGVLFSVTDGRAGFPASWLDTGVDGVSLRIQNDILEVLSPRAMLDYVGRTPGPRAQDGWLVTGDRVEVRGDRVLFAGRADGVVNIGGVKVVPETVEAALLAAPGVAEVAVRALPSPLTGHVLTADVVPLPGVEEAAVRASVRAALASLPPACRPRRLEIVACIPLSAGGKKPRGGNP